MTLRENFDPNCAGTKLTLTGVRTIHIEYRIGSEIREGV